MGMGIFDVAAVFWIFVAIAAVAGIAGDVIKRRHSLEPLRLAIERGQQLDPRIVEKLLRRSDDADRVAPAHVQIGGIITAASGVGVALLAFFIAQVKPQALYPIMGAGVVAICVGVGLREHRQRSANVSTWTRRWVCWPPPCVCVSCWRTRKA